MIQQIIIKNFKSIKELEFSAKRINLFIGKPNTGKSNLLEALGIFSLPFTILHSDDQKFNLLTRVDKIIDLFFNKQTSQKINVIVDKFEWNGFVEGNNLIILGKEKNSDEQFFHITIDVEGNLIFKKINPSKLPSVKFYRFRALKKFYRKEFSFLMPPDGENLVVVLLSHQEISDLVNDLLKECYLSLILDESELNIKLLRETPKQKLLFSYSSLSDTFQRIIFYLTAIESNKNSVLLFEEPEAHAFPYYTKILAEIIALDNSNNQYFITTHNPYFLISILEKAPKGDVAIFVTYLEDYQTKLKELDDLEKEKILKEGKDVFFNIDQIIQK
jgi:AAA15 family ATPase/GTPase